MYSYIPGEDPNPSDSGPIFTRKLKSELDINESQIIFYDEIINHLSAKKEATPVILVDDFVGTGMQCKKAWNDNYLKGSSETLSSYCIKKGHVFIYAPLIMNKL